MDNLPFRLTFCEPSVPSRYSEEKQDGKIFSFVVSSELLDQYRCRARSARCSVGALMRSAASHYFKNVLSIEKKHCPYCGSSRVIKYGKPNGKQRYQCRICKRAHRGVANHVSQ